MKTFSPEEIRARLLALAEPKFRDFSSALIPGGEPLLGVRLPALRQLAGEIGREDWRGYLKACAPTAEPPYFEEVMLRGMVIGAAPMELEERLEQVRGFLPMIHNWSVCDSFCAGLKTARKAPGAFYGLLLPCLESSECYQVRFGLVMLLDWYLNDCYIDRALGHFFSFCHPDYYAQMAAAWGISIAYVKYPHKTLPFLRENGLDDFTQNKAIQKIRESRRVPAADKEMLLALKRKGVSR